MFDFGFSFVGRLFMALLFRLISTSGPNSFDKIRYDAGYLWNDPERLFRLLAPYSIFFRLLLVLTSAHESEKIDIAPLVVDLCELLTMLLPATETNVSKLSGIGVGSRILRFTCKRCVESSELATVGNGYMKRFTVLYKHNKKQVLMDEDFCLVGFFLKQYYSISHLYTAQLHGSWFLPFIFKHQHGQIFMQVQSVHRLLFLDSGFPL